MYIMARRMVVLLQDKKRTGGEKMLGIVALAVVFYFVVYWVLSGIFADASGDDSIAKGLAVAVIIIGIILYSIFD